MLATRERRGAASTASDAESEGRQPRRCGLWGFDGATRYERVSRSDAFFCCAIMRLKGHFKDATTFLRVMRE